MRDDETDGPKRAVSHLIGEGLDTLSVEEIGQRIALLEGEIRRLEAARAAKKVALDTAASLFRL